MTFPIKASRVCRTRFMHIAVSTHCLACPSAAYGMPTITFEDICKRTLRTNQDGGHCTRKLAKGRRRRRPHHAEGRTREVAAAACESVLSVILSARLAELKRLLRETNDSIESITRRLGWTSPNYPKNLFKKRFGMSMSRWRMQSTIAAIPVDRMSVRGRSATGSEPTQVRRVWAGQAQVPRDPPTNRSRRR